MTHRTRRAQSLYRAAVYELARVLYLAEVYGWQSLSLNPPSYSRPSTEPPQPRRSGYVQFQALMPAGNIVTEVSEMITSREYGAALNALTPAQRGEIEQYYLRSPAKGDICPALEDSHYRAAYKAFEALLESLTLACQGKIG